MNPDDPEFKKIYRIFVKWYAMPSTSRELPSIPEFCEHHGIDKSVIAQFQDTEGFTEDLCREAIAWGKSKIPELLHTLYARYRESKNPNDLRMYKELLNTDKPSKEKADKDDARTGVLRELFQQSR